jgi:predicted NBD/HSP70 family sugar kinase
MSIKTKETVGEANKNAIVELIRKEGPISRADISRSLNICKPAVSSNVRVLLDTGVIREVGAGNNSIGKKSILLDFNKNKAYVAGVDIGNFKVRSALSNLSGEIIDIKQVEHGGENRGADILARACDVVFSLLESNNIAKGDLLAVGIGVPGIVDTCSGKNLLAPFISEWEDIDIESYFTDKFNTRIIIENNVNAGTIGEKWRGAASGYNNVVYINFGKGIGAGIIINRELLSGKNNAAGEISFFCPGGKYVQQSFQDAGPLERVISAEYIVRKYNSLDKNNRLTANSKDSFDEIFKKYDEGEANARIVMDEVLECVLILLINISAVLNPDAIIFGGGLGESMGRYFGYFNEGLCKSVPFPPELKLAKHGSLSGLYGAVGIALREANSDYRKYI